MTPLKNWHPHVYALARIVIGFLFLCHGIQKVLMGTPPEGMPAPMFWLTALIETFGGAMVMLGLLAGLAAFICSGTMAFAYFIAHFPHSGINVSNLLPINNKGELAVIYCFAFLLIASVGSGIWSVDSARGVRA
jgi:putative oxidoreductase